jgi:hypothetical protein
MYTPQEKKLIKKKFHNYAYTIVNLVDPNITYNINLNDLIKTSQQKPEDYYLRGTDYTIFVNICWGIDYEYSAPDKISYTNANAILDIILQRINSKHKQLTQKSGREQDNAIHYKSPTAKQYEKGKMKTTTRQFLANHQIRPLQTIPQPQQQQQQEQFLANQRRPPKTTQQQFLDSINAITFTS